MEDTVQEQLLKRLMTAHSSWYDIKEFYTLGSHTFRAMAEFHSFGEQYILSKRAKLWEINNHDHMFFDGIDELDSETLATYTELLTHEGLALTGPKPDQMSNNLTLVLVANSVQVPAITSLQKIKFRKNYKFGLQGWTDLRLAVLDLSQQKVAVNRAARDMIKTLRAIAKFA